jgi:hypothetical protein
LLKSMVAPSETAVPGPSSPRSRFERINIDGCVSFDSKHRLLSASSRTPRASRFLANKRNKHVSALHHTFGFLWSHFLCLHTPSS